MSLEPSFRITEAEDATHLTQWLSDPQILRWFPMIDDREIEDAVRIWINYANMQASITALYEGKPCAMACLYIQPYIKQKHTCLFSIIARKDLRGKGIGTKLLDYLMKWAKEQFQIEILHLEVYEGNPAQYLYERAGFKMFGRQSHFIKQEGQYSAKILMQRSL